MVRLIEDFQNSKGLWVKSCTISSEECRTRGYKVWSAMIERCTEGSNAQKRGPTYKGCKASESFKDFQYFMGWYVKQIGYGLPKYQIDKDILNFGGKFYSEEFCVLVPQQLNTFFISCVSTRRLYPQGVSWAKGENKFVSHISIDGKSVYLGYSSTPDDAYNLYRDAKNKEAQRWYKRLCDGEFIVDPRVIEVLKNWRLNE